MFLLRQSKETMAAKLGKTLEIMKK